MPDVLGFQFAFLNGPLNHQSGQLCPLGTLLHREGFRMVGLGGCVVGNAFDGFSHSYDVTGQHFLFPVDALGGFLDATKRLVDLLKVAGGRTVACRRSSCH